MCMSQIITYQFTVLYKYIQLFPWRCQESVRVICQTEIGLWLLQGLPPRTSSISGRCWMISSLSRSSSVQPHCLRKVLFSKVKQFPMCCASFPIRPSLLSLSILVLQHLFRLNVSSSIAPSEPRNVRGGAGKHLFLKGLSLSSSSLGWSPELEDWLLVLDL